MIDFHSHILPGMDDGSKSTEESLEMLRRLWDQGVKTVIATPHFYANDESVDGFLKRREKAYSRLCGAMTGEMPRVLPGAEVRFYPGICALRDLRSLCVQGSDVLLLEMPFSKWTGYTVKEVIDISCSGMISVVLAHIDRYMNFTSTDVLRQLVENDIMIQVNAEAFSHFFTRNKVFALMRSGLIHTLGSDCHNLTDRAPAMDIALAWMRKKFGGEFVNRFAEREEKILVQKNNFI